MDRKVMKPHTTLSDGTHIPAGNWMVVSQHAVMRDAALYPNPDEFDPSRFLAIDGSGAMKSKSRFSHPSLDFLYWGSARRAWYVHASTPHNFMLPSVSFVFPRPFTTKPPANPRDVSSPPVPPDSSSL
jgi:hypothetical protein